MKLKPLMLIGALAGGLLPLTLSAQYDTDLIGYWQFEGNLTESSGTHVAGTHDGTAVGTVAYGTGPLAAFGQGITFDGTNGVTVDGTRSDVAGYVNTFDDGVANSISISCWASGLPPQWSPFVAKNGEASGYQLRRNNNNPNGTFTLRGTAGAPDTVGSIDIATGQPVWTHYVATWDGTTGERKLYINGVEDAGAGLTGDTGPMDSPAAFWLSFGLRNTDPDATVFSNFFTGDMDDVAIWSRALSPAEAYQLGLAPLSDILLETDSDGDGLFDSQEATFGTSTSLTDTDGDGVSDFDEFVKGGDGTVDDDPDNDGLDNSEETSGSANPFGPGETTEWCSADSDNDGIDDGVELNSSNGSVTDPNNPDTDGDGFSDLTEINAGSVPTNAASVPPITAGLVGYWEFENDLVETSGAHPAGQHDGETTDGFPPEFGTGPTVAEGVNEAFGSSLNTVAEGTAYGVYVLGSNSAAGTTAAPYVDTYDAAIDSEFSISLWAKGWPGNWNPFLAKRGESNEGYQIRKRRNGANATFTLHQTAGAIDPEGSEGSGSGQPLWRHYLGTWNGATGERKLYVDGVLAFTVTGDFETGDVGAADDYWLTFGARHDDPDSLTFGNLFSGEIDDVAFWHREVTQAEATQLSLSPLSFIRDAVDTDLDGLFASQEAIFGTSDTDPDSDDDGVGDLEEFLKGSNGTLDDDPDNDGLLNSAETSGSSNPWVAGVNTGTPGGNTGDTPETTDWCAADSDLDGINDGDEISAVNGFVTDPNNADTDGDGFADGTEILGSTPTDPTDDQDFPTEWTRDLCGYWQFDSDLTDSGFLGADGIMLGLDATETYATGQFGQAIDLDKLNEQRVEVSGDENYLDSVGGDITVSVWVQVDGFDQQWQAIMSKGENQNWRIARRQNSNGPAFAGGAGDVPSSNDIANEHPINDGSWHHVVGVTRAGVSSSLWVDGILVEERTDINPMISDSVNAVLIGGNPDNATDGAGAYRSWGGNIDDAAVWKRALTDNEVTTLFYDGNDLQYLIDNDVTPTAPPVITDVAIANCFFDGTGAFNVEVTGLAPAASYRMMRSVLLDGSDWVDVGVDFTGGATNTFVDPAPLSKAFYQIFDVTAP